MPSTALTSSPTSLRYLTPSSECYGVLSGMSSGKIPPQFWLRINDGGAWAAEVCEATATIVNGKKIIVK